MYIYVLLTCMHKYHIYTCTYRGQKHTGTQNINALTHIHLEKQRYTCTQTHIKLYWYRSIHKCAYKHMHINDKHTHICTLIHTLLSKYEYIGKCRWYKTQTDTWTCECTDVHKYTETHVNVLPNTHIIAQE